MNRLKLSKQKRQFEMVENKL